jgi:hypothetical protein
MEEPSIDFKKRFGEFIEALEGMVTAHDACVDPTMNVCPHTKNACKTWKREYESLFDEAQKLAAGAQSNVEAFFVDVKSDVDAIVVDVKNKASEIWSMLE